MQQGVRTDATCSIKQCWKLLANNVASVCTGLNVNSELKQRRFERRTTTGSVLCSFWSGIFAQTSGKIVSIIPEETKKWKIWYSQFILKWKSSLPVDMRRSKTPLLKLPRNSIARAAGTLLFWSPVHGYHVKLADAMFREDANTGQISFLFSSWSWTQSLRFHLQEKFAYIPQIEWGLTNAIQLNRTKIHFLVKFSLPWLLWLLISYLVFWGVNALLSNICSKQQEPAQGLKIIIKVRNTCFHLSTNKKEHETLLGVIGEHVFEKVSFCCVFLSVHMENWNEKQMTPFNLRVTVVKNRVYLAPTFDFVEHILCDHLTFTHCYLLYCT